jgi:hypothetical protein
MTPTTYIPSQPTPFLDKLPLEIRQLIYDFLLHSCPSPGLSRQVYLVSDPSPTPIPRLGRFQFHTHPEKHHHNIQFANRQIHAEFHDTIRLLEQSNKLMISYDLVYPLPYDGRDLDRKIVRWKLFPTLRNHINRLTLDLSFELEPIAGFSLSSNWLNHIPSQFPRAPFIVLVHILLQFERTITRRYGPDIAPLTIDLLVINLTQPRYTLEVQEHDDGRAHYPQPSTIESPTSARNMKWMEKWALYLFPLFEAVDDLESNGMPDTRSRIKTTRVLLDGQLCWEQHNLIRRQNVSAQLRSISL